MLVVAVLFGSGFAALAGLIAAGQTTGLDAYAVHHWMPGLTPGLTPSGDSIVGALIPFYGADWPHGLDLAATVVSLPAYALVSAALYGGGLWLLARRTTLATVGWWAAAFVAGNAIEVLSKGALSRPGLSASTGHGLVQLTMFGASYPSGHALRSCLLAALAVRLWPRASVAAVPWAAATLVLLVAAGIHTFTDVVGGILLAGFLVALAQVGSRRIAVDRVR